jgi:hypothetical protein
MFVVWVYAQAYISFVICRQADKAPRNLLAKASTIKNNDQILQYWSAEEAIYCYA